MVSSVSMDKLFFPVHSYIEHRDHTIRHYSKSKQRDRAARHWNDYRAAISSSVQAIVRVPQITVFNFCFRILVSRHSRRKPSSHRSIIAFHNTHRRDRCDIIIHLAVIHRARCCVRHTHTHTHTYIPTRALPLETFPIYQGYKNESQAAEAARHDRIQPGAGRVWPST